MSGYNVESKFEHQGFLCVVITTDMGIRCGYIRIPKGHPWFRKGYSECTVKCKDDGGFCDHSPESIIDIHGGLTFSSDGEKGYPVEGPGWWFGFDCGHLNDIRDTSLMNGVIKEIHSKMPYPDMPGASIKDQKYVEGECRKLADQLASVKVVA